MDVYGFHHLAIQVRDLARMTAFYGDVLGLPEMVRHRRSDGSVRSVWHAVPGGGFVALEATPAAPALDEPFRREATGLLLFALRIRRDARGRIVQQLTDQGVVVVHETRWTVYIRDPEGNRIALSHYPEDPL